MKYTAGGSVGGNELDPRVELVEVIGPATPLARRVASVLEQHGHAEARATESGRLRSLRGTRGGWSTRESHDISANAVFTRWLQAYVVNALSTAPSEVRKQIRSLRESQPAALVFVLLDEASPEVVRAAFEAGATDFVGAAAASNPAALHWRISQIVGAAWSRKLVGWWQKSGSGPGSDIERGELEEPGEEEVAEALANVRAGLKRVRTASQALRAAAKLVTVLAPELRAESSGRFDAKKIAERLGISVNRLAPATGVSQQALSKRPDSPRAQKALASMARALTALSELYSVEEAKMWLNTPHPGLGNEPPLVRILDGRADAVARMLERTLEGIPD